jgi:hypothetical protein
MSLSEDFGELIGSRLWVKGFSFSDNHFTVDGTDASVSMPSPKTLTQRPFDQLTVWQKEVHSDAKNDGNDPFCEDEPTTVRILVRVLLDRTLTYHFQPERPPVARRRS